MQRTKSAKRKAKTQPINGNVRTTILIPEAVHRLGHELAKARRRSFSNLLTTLIEADADKAKREEVAA